METDADYELLKQAYAIIDGIPENLIAFGPACTHAGPSLADGTICSPEGWLAMHPAFQQLGLNFDAEANEVRYNDEPGESPAIIMSRVFRLPLTEAEQLFGGRTAFTGGDDSGLSDKRLWQRRICEYLQAKGELDETPAEVAYGASVTVPAQPLPHSL